MQTSPAVYIDLEDDEQRPVEVLIEDRWVVAWLVGSLNVEDVLFWARVRYCSDTPGRHIGWFDESRIRAA